MEFLAVDDVLGIHAELLARTGGTPGILNLGAVDSALYRCKWGPFFGDPGLEDRAALLVRGICQDHPFADGNKRTAFAVGAVFLQRNGQRLVASADEEIRFMLAVAQDQMELEAIAGWLRASGAKDKPREVE